jgi:hypothetical protein
MHPVTLCVTFQKRNAERPWRHSHAGAWERSICIFSLKNHMVAICSVRACSRWAAKQPPSTPKNAYRQNRITHFKTQPQTCLAPIYGPKPSPVYSAGLILPSSYTSLRHYLQLRQNPPACAPCPWVLSFPCHCPSVVGFSSSRFSARCMSSPLRQVFQFLSLMVAVRRALRRAGNAGIPGLLTCVQPPPFF